MNIVFMGSPDFAIPSLEKLHHSHHTIKAVVSNVDKRRGRGKETAPTPVKAKALELGLDVIEVEDLKSTSFEEQLKACEADLFVVVAFRVLPTNILEIPRIGSVNLHASLLPKYRGAAPIHWAVMNGETETGCTIFFLDERVDTGNIITQRTLSISEDETTGEVYERLMNEGSDELLHAVNLIEKGAYELQSQDDSLATPAPKLFNDNTRIVFEKSAEEVHNFIRGLNPFPSAWTTLDDKKVKIHRTKLFPEISVKPSTLKEHDGRLLIGTGSHALEVLEIQLPGKRKMTGVEYLNGYGANGAFV